MSYVSSTYRKKEFIQIVIEQTFILKKDYISKWFSVKEVYTEVLQEEEKIIFSNGEVVTKERKLYVNCDPTHFIHWVTDYKNNISMTYFSTGQEEKGEPPLKPKNDKIVRKWANGETYHEYYDSNRELSYRAIYDANNRLKADTNYIYDNSNLLVKIRYMKDYGKSKSEIIQQYNAQGKLIFTQEVDGDNKIISRTTYYYNSQGKETRICKHIRGREYNSKFNYDNNGNLISSDFYDDSHILRHGTYRYNQYGDTTYFDTWRNGKRIKEEYEYDKYDKYGNWLECRELKEGETAKFIRSQFKYIN